MYLSYKFVRLFEKTSFFLVTAVETYCATVALVLHENFVSCFFTEIVSKVYE